jgi:non-heme chloroperoxidase
VLISAVPPLMVKTPANPGGLPIEVFDGFRQSIQADRYQVWKDFCNTFYSLNRPGAKISEGLADAFFRQCSMAGFPASYLGIKAFSETDFTEDLKKFDMPTLIMHGDDDQVVPIAASALLSAKLVKNSILKVYPGLPHGMCQTHKDVINADLFEFIQAEKSATQAA